MFFVYVLKSRNFKVLYKGHTEDLKSRIKQHNSGKTRSIKAYRPLDVIYFEVYETREEAIKRERYFKSGEGRTFLKEKLKNASVVQLDRIPDFGSGG